VTNSSDPAPGSCLCGAVRFQATPPTLWCAHCHCSMCRRSHGAGFVTWFGIPLAQLKVLEGADVLVRHRSSDHATRSFCGRCGSSLFFETTQHPEKIAATGRPQRHGAAGSVIPSATQRTTGAKR
jgi:hypothetical protein